MRKSITKILVTGGAGFIGSEFVRQAVALGYSVAVVDKLTYAGDLKRLASVKDRYAFYRADICSKLKLEAIFRKVRPELVVHFAAETHVDRSIQDPNPFIKTNIQGTWNCVELSQKFQITKFVHISTDEVYGEISRGKFKESSPLHPNNPYSASKAAADLFILSAIRTYGFPAIIVRPSNNYGYWQYPEKFVPVIILKAKNNHKIPVYGKGLNVREWLHVADCNRAIHIVMRKGNAGQIYNIGSRFERKNIQTVKTILKMMGKPAHLIEFVQDRPGHDLRYSLDFQKIQRLGWTPQMNFNAGMRETLLWADEHYDWLDSKSKHLKEYWKKVYKKK